MAAVIDAPVYGSARQNVLTRLASRLALQARRRRHHLFVRATGLAPTDRILDVACGRGGLRVLDREHQITGFDRLDPAGIERPYVQGDARAMPFPDGAFDVVYCNSLIEHVGPADRARVANEIRRVAARYFVQTPNRWFPIEPHVLLPLFQFLPRALKRRAWRVGASRGPFEEIHLLTAAELKGLFPDAEIVRERLGPLTKSLMAVRGPTG